MTTDLDALRAAVKGLSLSVPRWVEDIGGEDATSLVMLLDDLRTLRQELAGIEAYAASQAARAMGRDPITLPDGRIAQRAGGWDRKDWDHQGILARLWAHAVEQAAGDLDQAADLFRAALVGLARIDYWKVTGLAAAGLDADDFSRRERSRATVRISAKPAGDAA